MDLKERIASGLRGDFQGLANGFNRINDYIFGIQKGTYYLVGAQSGNYKTTLTDFMLLHCIQDAKVKGIPLNVFYYSFEIDKLTKQCNWLSQIAYQKYQVIIPPEKVKGLGNFRLSKEEQEIIDSCIPDLEELFKYINFEFTPTNPTGLYNQLWKFSETRGTLEYQDYVNGGGETKKKIKGFVPKNSKEVTLVILDHLYLLKKEREFSTKENIDKWSEYCMELKTLFGVSFINIQQFNRSLSSVERLKFKGADLAPQESDFKETGNTYSDSDVAIGLMVPNKLDIEECIGYDINKLGDKFVLLKVIKNRLSKDSIGIGLVANPQAGDFKELPLPKEINYKLYE